MKTLLFPSLFGLTLVISEFTTDSEGTMRNKTFFGITHLYRQK